jgi:hypothetical protein
MDPTANNYNPYANFGDGSCDYAQGVTPPPPADCLRCYRDIDCSVYPKPLGSTGTYYCNTSYHGEGCCEERSSGPNVRPPSNVSPTGY